MELGYLETMPHSAEKGKREKEGPFGIEKSFQNYKYHENQGGTLLENKKKPFEKSHSTNKIPKINFSIFFIQIIL